MIQHGQGIGGVLPPPGMPGDFYVLAYDKDREAYTLYVDDEAQNSYDLGAALPARRHLALFGGPQADLAMDHAKQFGVVQVIPSEGRVLSLHSRLVSLDVFQKATTDAHYLPKL